MHTLALHAIQQMNIFKLILSAKSSAERTRRWHSNAAQTLPASRISGLEGGSVGQSPNFGLRHASTTGPGPLGFAAVWNGSLSLPGRVAYSTTREPSSSTFQTEGGSPLQDNDKFGVRTTPHPILPFRPTGLWEPVDIHVGYSRPVHSLLNNLQLGLLIFKSESFLDPQVIFTINLPPLSATSPMSDHCLWERRSLMLSARIQRGQDHKPSHSFRTQHPSLHQKIYQLLSSQYMFSSVYEVLVCNHEFGLTAYSSTTARATCRSLTRQLRCNVPRSTNGPVVVLADSQGVHSGPQRPNPFGASTGRVLVSTNPYFIHLQSRLCTSSTVSWPPPQRWLQRGAIRNIAGHQF
ncbi:hypothetical protein C8R44DRAFT_742005 [Mycena epipterygia]|nr:hypothetical protein C8R44DRAFT_742005 [Mycena epipterygia]